MSEKIGFGTCLQNEENCFAYVSKKCRILHNTEFHGRKCPFFKERGNKNNGREHTGSAKENHNFS